MQEKPPFIHQKKESIPAEESSVRSSPTEHEDSRQGWTFSAIQQQYEETIFRTQG